MIEKTIIDYIRDGINIELEKTFDKMKEDFIKDIDRRKNEICAGILMDVTKKIDIDSSRERTIFTIKEIKP